ncbi:putative MFS-type transporter EfpA [Amycolatopsis sp. CA-230715]|nr:putative MFS-type transporter EfpA [Amycolatopsis sp. CA-230715]
METLSDSLLSLEYPLTRSTLPAPPGTRAAPRPGLALAVLLTCQLMFILDATVMNVALPRIRADLGFSQPGLSWVMSSYTLVFGGLLLLGGRAGDLLGRRRMFVVGVTVFTVASFAGGFANSAEFLIISRVAQGIGAAMAGPSTLALVTTTVSSPAARVRALALFSAMASGGFAIGLILGGLLTEWFSWRAVLFINVPFGVAIATLAPRFVREPERVPAKLDLPGAVTATLGVGSLVYGFIRAGDAGWGDTFARFALGAGVVLIAAFLLIERRTAQPLMPLHLFTDRDRVAAYANFFLGPIAMMSMFFYLTQFLQLVLKLAPLTTGFAFLPMAAGIFGMSRAVPKLLPRFGPKPLAVTGSALMVAGLVLLTQVDTASAYFGSLFVPLLLMGLGGGMAFSPLNVVIMSTVRSEEAGAAGGALQTMQQSGAALGLAVLATVFGSATRDPAPGTAPADVFVTGMTHAYVVSAIVAAAILLVALTFRTKRRDTATASAQPALVE